MNVDQHDSNGAAPSTPLKTRTTISRQRFLQFVGLGVGAAALASRFLPRQQQAETPVTPDTLSHQKRVLTSVTTDRGSSPPFSFTYGGTAFPTNWTMASDYHQHLDAYRTRRAITWTHTDGKGQVVFELVAYHEFNLAEWIVTFNNRGASGATSEFANVLAINWQIDLGSTVTGIATGNGSQANLWDFGPAYPELSSAYPTRLFYCNGGRPTDGVSAPSGNTYLANGGWPYFNLRNATVSQPGTQGVITALGWPGQWAYQMSRGSTSTAVTLAGGMAHVDNFTGLPDITSANDPAQWQIADCYFGDFYQLAGTHYDQADQTIYCGWQFARPEQGDGMVQIFRRNRETAIGATRHWPLQGLINHSSVVYSVTDFDSGAAATYTGAYLTSTGLPATLAQGTAKTFKYTKVSDSACHSDNA